MALADVSPADLAAYREARNRFLAAADQADAAWLRWFTGETRNGAAASRLQNALGVLSANLASAQFPLFRADVDPADVDKLDGVQRDVSYG